MLYEALLILPKDKVDLLEKYCRFPAADCKAGETLFDKELVFSDGNRMAIQVITSLSPIEETAWTQGVLFDPMGNELGCTDVSDSFAGDYYVFSKGDTYCSRVYSQ